MAERRTSQTDDPDPVAVLMAVAVLVSSERIKRVLLAFGKLAKPKERRLGNIK